MTDELILGYIFFKIITEGEGAVALTIDVGIPVVLPNVISSSPSGLMVSAITS